MSATHHDPDHLRLAALTSARLAGCDCEPDIDLEPTVDGMYRCRIAHDPWCPLLARRTAAWN